MIRALLFFVALAGPANAQSFEEAVRQNLALGLEICLRHMPRVDETRGVLSGAGFVHTIEDFGGGEVIHWYAAPAGTMSVAIVTGQMAPNCRVSTTHMGVTEAVAFAGTQVQGRFPALNTQYGSLDNAPPITAANMGNRWEFCTGYVAWNGQRPITLSIANDGNDPACIEDGTAQIVIQH